MHLHKSYALTSYIPNHLHQQHSEGPPGVATCGLEGHGEQRNHSQCHALPQSMQSSLPFRRTERPEKWSIYRGGEQASVGVGVGKIQIVGSYVATVEEGRSQGIVVCWSILVCLFFRLFLLFSRRLPATE